MSLAAGNINRLATRLVSFNYRRHETDSDQAAGDATGLAGLATGDAAGEATGDALGDASGVACMPALAPTSISPASAASTAA
jgi:hypothetical protein